MSGHTQTCVSPFQRDAGLSSSPRASKGGKGVKQLPAGREQALSLSISASPHPLLEKMLQSHHHFVPDIYVHQETFSLYLLQLKDFRLFFCEWGAISHHTLQQGFPVHLLQEAISASLVLFILGHSRDKVKCVGVF